jgi:hypothetical protein
MAREVANTRIPGTRTPHNGSDSEPAVVNPPSTVRTVGPAPVASPASAASPAPVAKGRFSRPLHLVPHRLTAAERHRRISDLAYKRAEQRGFAPGNEVEDWLDAEREVDAGRY